MDHADADLGDAVLRVSPDAQDGKSDRLGTHPDSGGRTDRTALDVTSSPDPTRGKVTTEKVVISGRPSKDELTRLLEQVAPGTIRELRVVPDDDLGF